MTDSTDGGPAPVEGCHPCEVFKAFNNFCISLGRTKKMVTVQTKGGDVKVEPGQNACGVLANLVEAGDVDGDQFYDALVQLYGEDMVRALAIKHLSPPDALQKTDQGQKNEQISAEGGSEGGGQARENKGEPRGGSVASPPDSTPPGAPPSTAPKPVVPEADDAK